MSPLWAERVRTVLFTVLATAGTVLLLRVLFLFSRGALTVTDPEPWAFAGTVVLAVVWARAMKRVRRAPSAPEAQPPAPPEDGEALGNKGPAPVGPSAPRAPRTRG